MFFLRDFFEGKGDKTLGRLEEDVTVKLEGEVEMW